MYRLAQLTIVVYRLLTKVIIIKNWWFFIFFYFFRLELVLTFHLYFKSFSDKWYFDWCNLNFWIDYWSYITTLTTGTGGKIYLINVSIHTRLMLEWLEWLKLQRVTGVTRVTPETEWVNLQGWQKDPQEGHACDKHPHGDTLPSVGLSVRLVWGIFPIIMKRQICSEFKLLI